MKFHVWDAEASQTSPQNSER